MGIIAVEHHLILQRRFRVFRGECAEIPRLLFGVCFLILEHILRGHKRRDRLQVALCRLLRLAHDHARLFDRFRRHLLQKPFVLLCFFQFLLRPIQKTVALFICLHDAPFGYDGVKFARCGAQNAVADLVFDPAAVHRVRLHLVEHTGLFNGDLPGQILRQRLCFFLVRRLRLRGRARKQRLDLTVRRLRRGFRRQFVCGLHPRRTTRSLFKRHTLFRRFTLFKLRGNRFFSSGRFGDCRRCFDWFFRLCFGLCTRRGTLRHVGQNGARRSLPAVFCGGLFFVGKQRVHLGKRPEPAPFFPLQVLDVV